MIQVRPIPTAAVRRLRAGGPDAYGQPAERLVSDGEGNPCRHCLHGIPAGAPMLIVAWRPFPSLQPYAETGPIFLCADACAPWTGPGLPPVLQRSPSYIIRGYGADDRIVYGSGAVTCRTRLAERADALLGQPEIDYVHVRSASNNCFQARIERD